MTAPPYKVKAVYDYKSSHEDDLGFPNGQVITVTEEEDADWYIGEYIDDSGNKQEGLFPRNFVEKYEPEAPPRPTRTRTKKETAPPLTANPEPEDAVPEPNPQLVAPHSAALESLITPRDAAVDAPVLQAQEPNAEPKPVSIKPSSSAKQPPPVSEKPSSFKDRIAAFNKPSAAPIAPVKPGPGTSSNTGFIKKPFVAPPPARNSYVPPPRDPAPQKIYRREEDPEIAERQQQDLENAERAGMTAEPESGEGGAEEVKTTSLKQRIALLQKQQQEQAARRADISHKEKPKKPQKQASEPGEAADISNTTAADETVPDRANSTESQDRRSTDLPREAQKPPVTGRRPSREPRNAIPDMVSDGNEADQSGAGDTTEDGGASSTEVEDPVENRRPLPPMPPSRTSTTQNRDVAPEGETVVDEHGGEDEDDEGEDSMDEETRRKVELRQRMAKMSGGMGMPGMFAMPQPAPAPKKKRSSAANDDGESLASPPSTQRIPMVPMPGIPRVQSPEHQLTIPVVEQEQEAGLPALSERHPDELPDVEDLDQKPAATSSSGNVAPPPIPQERPAPVSPPAQRAAPPVPSGRPVPVAPEVRSAPPLPPSGPRSPQALPESEHESKATQRQSAISSRQELPIRAPPPPVPGGSAGPMQPDGPRPPPVRPNRPSFVEEPASSSNKRQSREVPPIPTGVPTMPPAPVSEVRPPPPPPPTAAPPTRQSTGRESLDRDVEEESEDGESDYEGDYDTDIAPGAEHRNALNKVQEEASFDETTLSEGKSPTSGPPPLPIMSHRGAPPPPPHHAPTTRPSVDIPRAPPPAPPGIGDIDYDPYSYQAPTHGIPSPLAKESPYSPPIQASDPALYGEVSKSSIPLLSAQSGPSQDRGPPPPPSGAARQSRDLPRNTMELPRPSLNVTRRSMEQGRPSMDRGQIAQDVELSETSLWWTQPNTPPPIFQNRPDILTEFEESSTSKRGGRTTISKDAYVLFQDYSQTVVTARFDSKNPSDVALEQRHEPSPTRLRQDELEEAHAHLGQSISSAASSKQNSTIGDGTAQALILDVLLAQKNALLPVGTRSYGALVYANMANATVQQFDEIRAGDIISFRNAKFSGKHGAMHAKYSEDVGKPEHVGIVVEWDGTKKKVKALEQGRESKKAKVESFRVGDLRSGEVKVWRVMDRQWVGWGSN